MQMYRLLSILPIFRMTPTEGQTQIRELATVEQKEKDGLQLWGTKVMKGVISDSQYLNFSPVTDGAANGMTAEGQ